MSIRTLIVLPDESPKPFLDAINAAKKSPQVKMFVFSDPVLLNTVVAAHQRGVKVRVMLNAARRDGEDDNKEVRKATSPWSGHTLLILEHVLKSDYCQH